MVHRIDDIEAALEKAAERGRDLTADERDALREVLQWWQTWKAWGRLGKIMLWLMITAGATVAAAREVFQWFER